MPTHVAIFGLLGSGNIGNHGSFEAVLNYLRKDHPDADIICVCADPHEMTRQYGLRAISITWYGGRPARLRQHRVLSAALKLVGKGVDAVRTLTWVRKVDVVIVPGMGVLETTLPIRPWGVPYALFLIAFWSRVSGTALALVSVGANVIPQRATRWLIATTATMARYRSYRDQQAREAMRLMGVDTSRDEVYPDLAFALPVPSSQPEPQEDTPPTARNPRRGNTPPTALTLRRGNTPPTALTLRRGNTHPTVGLGVMDYSGTHLDRHRADEIFAGYIEKVIAFVRELLATGYRVRLFTGDPADLRAVEAIRGEVDDERVSFTRADSLTELMVQMETVGIVVASRFHNVLVALTLGKPTVSLSYAAKNDVLMEDMGMGEFCQPIRAIDVPRLLAQVRELEHRRDQIAATLHNASAHNTALLEQQFAALTAAVLPQSVAS